MNKAQRYFAKLRRYYLWFTACFGAFLVALAVLEKEGMPTRVAIILAGKTRMTPVLLTATATILGLIPLAVGLNMDFVTLFTELNPHIYFGGDSVAFWGPLSWTMIFGLSFATFLTLILVPAMYLLVDKLKVKLKMKKPDPILTEAELEKFAV